MVPLLPDCPSRGTSGFQNVVRAFLSGTGLPFAEVLSAERIERVFRKHRCDFGQRGMYTAAVMLWSFLSQVLRDGKEAACQAAVARVISYCQLNGLSAPTADTGDYCRARAKLSAAAIRELSCEVAAELETNAEPAWLWKGQYHAKLIGRRKRCQDSFFGWLWSVSSVVVDAVTSRAAERQLTLRSADRRARVAGEAAGGHAPLLGRTQKRVLTRMALSKLDQRADWPWLERFFFIKPAQPG